MIRPHDLVTYSLPQIRRAAPADIPAIVAIENESFVDPWDQSVFLEALTYYPYHVFRGDLRRGGCRFCRGRP